MKTAGRVFLITVFLLVAVAAGAGEKLASFSPYVDVRGEISRPSAFRSGWVHLGTWLLTSKPPVDPGSERTAPGAGVHNVYTQPESLRAYERTGTWPDGAVLVMEVRAIRWDDLPTGHVIGEGEAVKWFVMVKDAEGRFPGNPHWGDGWGWAAFEPGSEKRNVSTDYRKDCRDCHALMKPADWVFVPLPPTGGYPLPKPGDQAR